MNYDTFDTILKVGCFVAGAAVSTAIVTTFDPTYTPSTHAFFQRLYDWAPFGGLLHASVYRSVIEPLIERPLLRKEFPL
jgi:hypothetical protein